MKSTRQRSMAPVITSLTATLLVFNLLFTYIVVVSAFTSTQPIGTKGIFKKSSAIKASSLYLGSGINRKCYHTSLCYKNVGARSYATNKGITSLFVHNKRNNNNDDDFRDAIDVASSSYNNNNNDNKISRLRRFAKSTKRVIHRLFTWQQKQRRSLLVAAAFALTLVFASTSSTMSDTTRSTAQSLYPTANTVASTNTEINRVAPVKYSKTQLASSSSSPLKDSYIWQTRGGTDFYIEEDVPSTYSDLNINPTDTTETPSFAGSTESSVTGTDISALSSMKSLQDHSPLNIQHELDVSHEITASTTDVAASKKKGVNGYVLNFQQLLPTWMQKQSTIATMESVVEEGALTTSRTFRQAVLDLASYMQGPKSDTLLLLLATALITPLCKQLKTSPILGFLAAGMLLGPNGCGLISGIHTTETLAELGIVFFLFEMGIELSFERLLSMRKDVFGLGLSQFLATALVVAGVGKLAGLPGNALVVLGGGLALSSSAFVLQLLKDKNQLATRFGKASFGILLFQDLAVVPLLVVTPILAGSGTGLASALGTAVVKASIALGSIALAGRFVLNRLFRVVAQSQSQEAFLGVILLTVLSMSFMTEGLGLSNTLGAFLAGVLLSETKYRYQIEADIAPFRGILLGLFFVTVGFEIDIALIASQLPLVGSIVLGIMVIKTLITTALSLAFGLSLSTSQQTGLILSQGGEFAFVAFGLARSLGILDQRTTKLLLTCSSLTMALTPLMSTVGARIAKQLEEKSDFTHYLGQDRDANEIKASDDFTVVVGYGAVGKVVCDLLDRKFIKYAGLEIDPNKAIQARNAGLPVFYGDIGRQEVAEAFNVGKAKAVIVCISDKAQCNRVVIALRRWYPDLKIFARARDADHANRLQNTLNVVAMVPILPEDNLLLTLPFGGAVMKALGVPPEEVNAILESRRKELLSGRGLEMSEEQAALLQLGIAFTNSTTQFPMNDEQAKELRNRLAAERRAALQKSPFVKQVIEEVCPGSASDDEECVPLEVIQDLQEGKTPEMITSSGNSTATSSNSDTINNSPGAFQ